MSLVSPRKRFREKSPSIGEKATKYYNTPQKKDGNNIYSCKDCGREINGTKLHNLACHIEHCHKALFALISKKKKDPLHVKRLKLLQNAVEIVTVNGKPFNFLLASGYQAGIENKLQKLIEAGYPLDMKHSSLFQVKNHLKIMAARARDKIRDCVRDREVSVLIDIVTKNNRSIIGISVQFLLGGELKVISLGMLQLEKAHTGAYLAEVCVDCLQKYEIAIRKVITITRDNGANVTKMVRDMHTDLQNSASENVPDLKSPKKTANATENSETDNDIAQLLAEVGEISDEEALDNVFENAFLAEHQRVLENVAAELRNKGFDTKYDITGVNCAAHTLQLAILDALKAIPQTQKNMIELVRRIAKLLRLPKSEQQVKEAGIRYKRPRLDVVTRWGSMYQMVSMNYF